MFKDIAEAYKVLSDKEQRKRYDFGQGDEEISDFGEGFDPFSIFKEFFSSHAGEEGEDIPGFPFGHGAGGQARFMFSPFPGGFSNTSTQGGGKKFGFKFG